ncbi:hypothetical protein SCLCIDRAFT_667203 [Scleroderma citrinum Foug A]|uniref:Uncharacterized protein n=1 Tax=Scleroderma citrinum Foug A TaxID=1036808 RepID=A0A0C3CRI6_9AGAM|nr:hypothetical protein SCLCIDRAFT_667203 [Scleroderma citrinum Foug A]
MLPVTLSFFALLGTYDGCIKCLNAQRRLDKAMYRLWIRLILTVGRTNMAYENIGTKVQKHLPICANMAANTSFLQMPTGHH